MFPMGDLLHLLTDPAVWAALVTLIAMEVVLGIDNLIFISILTNKLPEHQRQRARMVGLSLDLVFRLLLLGGNPPIFSSPAGYSWFGRRPRRSTTASIRTPLPAFSIAAPLESDSPPRSARYCF